MHIRFYVTMGKATFISLRPILLSVAEDCGVKVVFLPSGRDILDLGVQVEGAAQDIANYMELFADLVYLWR